MTKTKPLTDSQHVYCGGAKTLSNRELKPKAHKKIWKSIKANTAAKARGNSKVDKIKSHRKEKETAADTREKKAKWFRNQQADKLAVEAPKEHEIHKEMHNKAVANNLKQGESR